jgi:hypothetical protein
MTLWHYNHLGAGDGGNWMMHAQKCISMTMIVIATKIVIVIVSVMTYAKHTTATRCIFFDFVCMPFWHNFSTGISSWSAPNAIKGQVMDTASSFDAAAPAATHR